jgi:hypothetical protein
MGSLEALVAVLADQGAFGDKGESVTKAFGAIVGLAKSIVSAVCTGGSSAASIASSVLALTADVVGLARTAYEVAMAELGKKEEIDPTTALALEIVGLCLDMGSVVAGASGGSASAPAGRSSSSRAGRAVELAAEAARAGLSSGKAGVDAAAAMAGAAADEAQALADAEKALAEAARRRMQSAREGLSALLADLQQAREDAESMLGAGSIDVALLGGARA